MAESFLEEQLKRIRAMTERMAAVKSYVSELGKANDAKRAPEAHPARRHTRKGRPIRSGPLRRAEQL
jgi:hypothetical protein